MASFKPQRPDSTPPSGSQLPPVAVVCSRYNASVTDRLLEGAIQAYVRRGGDAGHIQVLAAPGAYELPALSLAAARTGRFRGVVALGCLIKGETLHDKYIAEAVAHGLVQVTLMTSLPVAFGLLTVDTPAQAAARAGGNKGNKGAESMDALLDTLEQTRLIESPKPSRFEAARVEQLQSRSPRLLPDKALIAANSSTLRITPSTKSRTPKGAKPKTKTSQGRSR